MIPDSIARKYGKIAEFNGRDLDPTGVHKDGHTPTADEQLRLVAQTADPTGATMPYDGAFFGLHSPDESVEGEVAYD